MSSATVGCHCPARQMTDLGTCVMATDGWQKYSDKIWVNPQTQDIRVVSDGQQWQRMYSNSKNGMVWYLAPDVRVADGEPCPLPRLEALMPELEAKTNHQQKELEELKQKLEAMKVEKEALAKKSEDQAVEIEALKSLLKKTDAAEKDNVSSGSSSSSESDDGMGKEQGAMHLAEAEELVQEPLPKRFKDEFTQEVLIKDKLMRFEGCSSLSKVPISFYLSRDDQALRYMQSIFLPLLETVAWGPWALDDSQRWSRQRQVYVKLSKKAHFLKSNGGDWLNPAPREARKWWNELCNVNTDFFQRIEGRCKDVKFTMKNQASVETEVDAFLNMAPGEFKHNLLTYATVQQKEFAQDSGSRPASSDQAEAHNSYDYGAWHVDGGPSSLFLAASLQGSRTLQIENSAGHRMQKILDPGSFYISQPSGFWHSVDFHGSSASFTSLILRSGVLKRRISGGREQVKNGIRTRSRGMVYATRAGFEQLSSIVSDVIAETFQECDFQLPIQTSPTKEKDSRRARRPKAARRVI
eukprot:TRINITY_DN18315_c0_g1_i1.p1 TRINITY_DN18315_c0_g1~~TRINITY_DN18315_c0_g1_i1.p1  ORF type:complete len:524 (-),score=93.21 TRINITY_DN18315_c0_g1_i1:104-1675(-)